MLGRHRERNQKEKTQMKGPHRENRSKNRGLRLVKSQERKRKVKEMWLKENY